jgi:hypothetical protein
VQKTSKIFELLSRQYGKREKNTCIFYSVTYFLWCDGKCQVEYNPLITFSVGSSTRKGEGTAK